MTKITVTTLKNNGLMLNESRVSVKKSNIEGTTGTNRIKFVERIQDCFNSHSKTFKNVFRVAFAEDTLLMVWDKISKKNLEEGYSIHSDKVLLFKIREMSTCLTNSCYKFGISKKACIYTKNTGRQHLITVMSPCDKIVMHSVYMVFKLIFDGFCHGKLLNTIKNCRKIIAYHCLKPNFYSAHSKVKLGKSCHEVLRDVQTWYFCCWFIKINIHKFFDKVNHNRLLNILRETVDDEPLLALLRQILNKEIFLKKHFNLPEKNTGVLQGTHLDILLTNVYLNKLDQFVLKRKKAHWEKNCIYINNNEAESLSAFVNPLKEIALNNQKSNFTKVFKQQKSKTAELMGLSKWTFSKRMFRRIYYSRYTDNFLFGIRGPKILAMDVQDETTQFIRCNLQLELHLTEIYHAKSNKVKYLGFNIKVFNSTHNHKSTIKNMIAFKKMKKKLEQKKSIAQTHKEALLNQVLYKKMTKITTWIQRKMTHKTRPNKTTHKLIQIELLNALNSSILKSPDGLKDTKHIHSLESIRHMITRNKSYLNKLFQESSSDNSSKQFYQKKIDNISNHIIYRTLYSYQNDANPMLYAPKKSILTLMRNWGMVSVVSGKPVPNKMLFRYHDLSIILRYKNNAKNILEYYKPARNFRWVKKQVDHQMRHSLLITLAKKHKTSLFKIIEAIGKSTSIYINNGSGKLKEVAAFLTPTYIRNKKSGFNNTLVYTSNSTKLFNKTSIPKTSYHKCQIKNCKKNDIKMYNIRALYQKISPNYIITSMKNHTTKIHWTKIVELALLKRQISLCTKHHLAIHAGRLFLEDLELSCTSFRLLNYCRLDIKF